MMHLSTQERMLSFTTVEVYPNQPFNSLVLMATNKMLKTKNT